MSTAANALSSRLASKAGRGGGLKGAMMREGAMSVVGDIDTADALVLADNATSAESRKEAKKRFKAARKKKGQEDAGFAPPTSAQMNPMLEVDEPLVNLDNLEDGLLASSGAATIGSPRSTTPPID